MHITARYHIALLITWRALRNRHTSQGPGPFTVVAPINQGFEALGRNVLDFVLNPHNVKA